MKKQEIIEMLWVLSIVFVLVICAKIGQYNSYKNGVEYGASAILDTMNTILDDQKRDTANHAVTKITIQSHTDTNTYVLSTKTFIK